MRRTICGSLYDTKSSPNAEIEVTLRERDANANRTDGYLRGTDLVRHEVLWNPVLKAMEDRSNRIAEGLAAAEQGIKDREEAEAKAQEELREAREQAKEIIAQANKRGEEIVESAGGGREEGERMKPRSS